MDYQLVDQFIVASDLPATWAFFSDAENLPDITPAKMKFTILSPRPIELRADTVLDYSVTVAGIPLRWRTLIIEWSPPRQFIDLQVRGPYALWHHQHTFEQTERGTLCRDRVIYRVGASIFGRAAHALFVRKQLREIFGYRRKIIAERLGWVSQIQAVEISPLK